MSVGKGRKSRGAAKKAPVAAASAAPAATTPAFQPPEELETLWNETLTEAWLKLNERQQKFLKIWYTNGFNATRAYMEAYKQENVAAARVCACQLLTNPNILEFRKVIWNMLTPPIELMAAVESAALEAEEDIDPKKYKLHLMKVDAVRRMREYHRMLPAREVKHTHGGEVKHDHTVDVTGLEGLFNGGAAPAQPAPG